MDLFRDEQRAYDNAENHAKAVRSGAAYDFEEFEALLAAYRFLLKQLRGITRYADRATSDLHESNAALHGKVFFDALTGIYNRRFMEEKLESYVKSLSRSRSRISIMIIDVDFFKLYNDTYGHDAGDTCLKLVAQALSKCFTREEDFVARYGGEEFVVALPYTDEFGADLIATKLLDSVRSLKIPHAKSGVADYVTVSIGGTTVDVKHDHSCIDYIKCADKALYLSKTNGRNRYTHTALRADS